MWDKFKQHFNQLFHSVSKADEGVTKVLHTEKQGTENKHNQPYQKIESKVTYYYPKEREFKFPMSIDDIGKKEKEYTVHRTSEKRDKDNVKTAPKKPFKATDVPSPIHGYNKRAERLIEGFREENDMNKGRCHSPTVSNILNEVKRTRGEMSEYSYERMGQKKTVPKEEFLMGKDLAPSQNEEVIEKQVTSHHEIEKIKNETSIFSEVKPSTKSEVTISLFDEDSVKDNSEDDSTPQNEARALLRRKPLHQSNKDKEVKEEQTKSKETRKTPFNVRMRPSDKKRYYDRLKQENQLHKTFLEDEATIQRNQYKLNKQPVNNKVEDNHNNPQEKDVLPLHLLNDPVVSTNEGSAFIKQQTTRLINALAQFNVQAQVVNVMQGPSVTRFEIKPETGVKVSKVKNLSDDLKLSLAAKDIRIEAPIPGKHAIGIEIPNDSTRPVMLSEILNAEPFHQATSPLTVGLGLDISGEAIVTDIQKMPHGLIAGATGSGKSVCINTILLSLLYKASPEEVRLLLIDPKMVELQPYNDLPHLVSPVITDVKAATQALKWAVEEMERRYQQFVEIGARDLSRYNDKMRLQGQDTLPMIVIVIDELADLMMAAPQDVEDAICRIAQKARAAGIHMILATQRPSVDVVTGLIKSNIPSRIAFSVASQVDSRTMIDTVGAERLLGKGDMLFVENGARHPVRIQGAFVSDDEIERITAFLKKQRQPNYLFEQEQLLQSLQQEDATDELYDEALDFISENDTISTSLLQRRFKIGYNRAARIIDSLEYKGIVSGQNGSKPRTILVSKEELDHIRYNRD